MMTRPYTEAQDPQKEDASHGNQRAPRPRIVGSLRSADGAGVVRLEGHLDAGIADLWSALTDPDSLTRWLGEIDGDLSLGGEFQARFFATGWEGRGSRGGLRAATAPSCSDRVTRASRTASSRRR